MFMATFITVKNTAQFNIVFYPIGYFVITHFIRPLQSFLQRYI